MRGGGVCGVAQVVAHRGEGHDAGDDAVDTEELGGDQPGGGRGGLLPHTTAPTPTPALYATGDTYPLLETTYFLGCMVQSTVVFSVFCFTSRPVHRADTHNSSSPG